jgi:hypothetical protein
MVGKLDDLEDALKKQEAEISAVKAMHEDAQVLCSGARACVREREKKKREKEKKDRGRACKRALIHTCMYI